MIIIIEVMPSSPISWGNINEKILNASILSNNILLNLSNFINTLDYYAIFIPNTVLSFTILGNPSYSFNATISAEDNRLNELTLLIENLNLIESENIPVIDIATDIKDNKLIFKNNNTLKNLSISEESNNSAISILLGTKLLISGSEDSTSNTLTVVGGVYSSAIGGGIDNDIGSIVIYGNSTKIYASGGVGGCGIGGGINSNGGNILICDSSIISSVGGNYGCGIGGGHSPYTPGSSGDITITNSAYVRAKGGVGAAGIGGGSCFYSSGGNIDNLIISEFATVFAFGDYAGAGIGGGFGFGNIGGYIKNLRISDNSIVYAIGGNLAAGIGGGYGSFGGYGGNINISDCTKVYSYGGLSGGGISGGAGGRYMGIGGSGGKVKFSEYTLVTANAGVDGASIGGGAGDMGGKGGVITVRDYSYISTNTFIGYYKNFPSATLEMDGGFISTGSLCLTNINMGGGATVVNDISFSPTIKTHYFISVKLIYPNGTPYRSPISLRKCYDICYKYTVTPNEFGEVNFYVSSGNYYFSSLSSDSKFITKSFSSPIFNDCKTIILTVPKENTKNIDNLQCKKWIV